MILRARSLLTMDGPPIENGAVAVSADTIVDVGSYPDVRARNSGDVVDLGECALLPGLINAHCHLDYTCLRGQIRRPSSFAGWIREINERKAALTPDDYVQSIAAGFAEAASFGTTTIANLEAFPSLLPRVIPSPLRTWWFAEMIDVRGAVSASEIHTQMSHDLAAAGDALGHIGLAPHAPFTASVPLYRATAEIAAAHGSPASTHLAESREEMEMFSAQRGALFDLMSPFGRLAEDAERGTPVASMLQHNLLNDRWIVAHLNEVTEADFELLASAPKFHVVHCPRSHDYFQHSRFAFERLNQLGFNICLGTDSLASNKDLSLFREMRQLSRTIPGLAPPELLEMVTIRAAKALRQQDAIGRLRVGFKADLIAVASTATQDSVFEEVLHFDGKVPWSMVNGSHLRTV